MDKLKDLVNRLYDTCQISHSTWCNALRYIDGDYQDHKLVRGSFLRCLYVLGL